MNNTLIRICLVGIVIAVWWFIPLPTWAYLLLVGWIGIPAIIPINASTGRLFAFFVIFPTVSYGITALIFRVGGYEQYTIAYGTVMYALVCLVMYTVMEK